MPRDRNDHSIDYLQPLAAIYRVLAAPASQSRSRKRELGRHAPINAEWPVSDVVRWPGSLRPNKRSVTCKWRQWPRSSRSNNCHAPMNVAWPISDVCSDLGRRAPITAAWPLQWRSELDRHAPVNNDLHSWSVIWNRSGNRAKGISKYIFATSLVIIQLYKTCKHNRTVITI